MMTGGRCALAKCSSASRSSCSRNLERALSIRQRGGVEITLVKPQGQGLNPLPISGRRASRIQDLAFAAPAIVLFCAVFVVPVGYILTFSFSSDGQFSLAGYEWIANSQLFGRVLWTSIEIALLATLVSVLTG